MAEQGVTRLALPSPTGGWKHGASTIRGAPNATRTVGRGGGSFQVHLQALLMSQEQVSTRWMAGDFHDSQERGEAGITTSCVYRMGLPPPFCSSLFYVGVRSKMQTRCIHYPRGAIPVSHLILLENLMLSPHLP